MASKYGSVVNDKLGQVSSNFFNYIGAEHGRESESGSRVMFAALLLLLVYIVYWLPSITDFTKLLQVSNFLVTLSIFLLLAFSLNIHTGMTGLVNFGVIFFVAVGAIIVGVLTAPSDKFGYDWDIIPAVIVALSLIHI